MTEGERKQREVQRLQAAREAEERERQERRQRMAQPTFVAFRDLVDFPEKYQGLYVRVNEVELDGSEEWNRIRELGYYGVSVSQNRKTSLSSLLLGSEGLVFLVEENWGRSIKVERVPGNGNFAFDLSCFVTTMKDQRGKDFYVARIYHISRRLTKAGLHLAQAFKDPLETERQMTRTYSDPGF